MREEKDLDGATPRAEDSAPEPHRVALYLGNWFILDQHGNCMAMSTRQEWAQMVAKGLDLLCAPQASPRAPEPQAEGPK